MSAVRVGFDGYIQHRLQSRDGESRRSESIRLNSTRIFDQDGIPTIPHPGYPFG